MSRSYQSNWSSVGSTADPDILYYNASIVNNNTDDSTDAGYAIQDPLVIFNETRDMPMIKDASQYQFSIIRFVVNGANKDLPLFIPAIQSSTGQIDPNLTEYGFGLSGSFTVKNAPNPDVIFNIAPPITYVSYIPEIQNNILAPIPTPPSSPYYVGAWNILNPYLQYNIVSQTVINATTGLTYQTYYSASMNVPIGTALDDVYSSPLLGITSRYWNLTSSELGRPQDINTRYYWVYTFQHWVSLLQNTLETANLALYTLLSNAITTATLTNPWPTYANFIGDYPTPLMTYDIPSGLFSITYPTVYLSVPSQPAPLGLYMNQNMEGLLSNFYTIYYNSPKGDGSFATNSFPYGYVYKAVIQIQDLGANIIPNADVLPHPTYAGNFIKMTQECKSTSTLWSPVESIVFTSNLLPIQNEQTAPPNRYGSGNLGLSSATAPSAFQPIITDIANDLSSDSFAWRKMIYYAPAAEYRMADFQNSKTEIKSIDIQVNWKNRLNNQLYPLRMFNLSSVSIKMMFRKKGSASKTERTSAY